MSQQPLNELNAISDKEAKDGEERMKQYKNVAKHEDMRRRRTGSLSEIHMSLIQNVLWNCVSRSARTS